MGESRRAIQTTSARVLRMGTTRREHSLAAAISCSNRWEDSSPGLERTARAEASRASWGSNGTPVCRASCSMVRASWPASVWGGEPLGRSSDRVLMGSIQSFSSNLGRSGAARDILRPLPSSEVDRRHPTELEFRAGLRRDSGSRPARSSKLRRRRLVSRGWLAKARWLVLNAGHELPRLVEPVPPRLVRDLGAGIDPGGGSREAGCRCGVVGRALHEVRAADPDAGWREVVHAHLRAEG